MGCIGRFIQYYLCSVRVICLASMNVMLGSQHETLEETAQQPWVLMEARCFYFFFPSFPFYIFF